ncbi:MAG: F0F1 ATP synthase subunit epsilon [Sulfurospirillum sp.]|nr:MAG: F0F1 ATP synthase subunit epsilon [Sulfurospirillum sp.]
MATMKMEIVTPHGVIFDGDVKSVTLPGTEGEFGVLPHHASLMTTLSGGVIEIVKADDSKELVAIDWGHVKVDGGKISVLADGAVALGGTSDEIAKHIEEAKKLIQGMSDSDVAIAAAMAKVETAAKSGL